MKGEPVVTRSAIAAAVSLLVTLLALFHVTVPGDVAEAITNAVYAIAPVVAWAWAAFTARARVEPVKTPPQS